MSEIRIVSPGKIRRYPYPVCKKLRVDCIWDWLKRGIFLLQLNYTRLIYISGIIFEEERTIK